jgi:hypothetical protein
LISSYFYLLCADKILLLTKYSRRQNVGVDQIFASAKRQQNTPVDKMLASTKYPRQQNVGACVEASLYCFGPAEFGANDFSQTSLMFSYLSL